jgi:hypothetical protein
MERLYQGSGRQFFAITKYVTFRVECSGQNPIKIAEHVETALRRLGGDYVMSILPLPLLPSMMLLRRCAKEVYESFIDDMDGTKSQAG